jgi:hypothetical protein
VAIRIYGRRNFTQLYFLFLHLGPYPSSMHHMCLESGFQTGIPPTMRQAGHSPEKLREYEATERIGMFEEII